MTGAGRAARHLGLLLMAGTAVRLALAFGTGGAHFDIDNLGEVAALLRADPLHLYGEAPWQYPPLMLPSIWLADEASSLIRFETGVRLLPILADALLAVAVALLLRPRGASAMLAGCAIVMFGTTFVATAGYSGHFDSVGTAATAFAVLIWLRGGDRRALAAGALIGFAAATKSPHLLMLGALFPTARSRREMLELAAVAVAIPAAMMLPFAIADPSGVLQTLKYRGLPGLGGISVLVQPDLAPQILTGTFPGFSAATDALSTIGRVVTPLTLLAVALLLIRARVEPLRAGLILWLTFSVVSLNLYVHWLGWLIPLIVATGRFRWAVALQILLLPPTIVYYGSPWDDETVVWVAYVPWMAAVLVATIALLRTASAESPDFS